VQLIVLLLALLSAPAFAAVLPEERADVLYHRYEGGGMTIDGPSVLVRKSFKEKVSVSANYYVDQVSAASIDVVTAASPYTEERKEKGVGVDWLAGKAIYSLGYARSVENDYDAKTLSFGASQDFFGDLTTISLGYAQGDDTITKTGDPLFSADAKRRNFRFGLTQVLTRNWIAALSHELITDEGFLNNPYRSVRYRVGSGYSFQAERYPNTRTSEASALRSAYYLPWKAAVHAEYRRFQDSWGIEAKDWALMLVQPFAQHFEVEFKLRQYEQTAADFYSDLFPFADAQNFLARDKEMSTFDADSYGVALSWEFLKRRWRLVDRFGLRVQVDRYAYDYKDFRDLRYSVSEAGTEPLYSFDATVSQVLFTVWY
jgi:hypothetical protein